ncbi:MAG TPA: DUF2283 domain-containing protein [Anaerolineae bacterium]|nr:DUF2283 domain-containing protein [Anaerolineae bacterium]
MKKYSLSYDDERDVLYVTFRQSGRAATQSLSPNIVLSYDRDLNQATGLTLIGFSEMIGAATGRPLPIVLEHLAELRDDKRRMLLEILRQPPMTDYLRILDIDNGKVRVEVISQPVLTGLLTPA